MKNTLEQKAQEAAQKKIDEAKERAAEVVAHRIADIFWKENKITKH